MKINATVDLTALHKAISKSIQDVLTAHGLTICNAPVMAIDPISTEYVEAYAPLGDAGLAALFREMGRNAAQACLAQAIEEQSDSE